MAASRSVWLRCVSLLNVYGMVDGTVLHWASFLMLRGSVVNVAGGLFKAARYLSYSNGPF